MHKPKINIRTLKQAMSTLFMCLGLILVISACDLVTTEEPPHKFQEIIWSPNTYTVTKGGATDINLLAGDTLYGDFEITITPPQSGTLTHLFDFTYRYKANDFFTGTDTIKYLIKNRFTEKACHIIIRVNNPCNFQANADSLIINENHSGRLNVVANDSLCNIPWALNLPVQPARAQVTIMNTDLIINPQDNYWGTFWFNYQLNASNSSQSSTAQVKVSVLPDTNCKNSFVPMGDLFNTPVTDQILIPFSELVANDQSCPGDRNPLSLQLLQNSLQYGTLQVFTDYLVYTPSPSSRGRTETITYTVASNRFPSVRKAALIQILIQ